MRWSMTRRCWISCASRPRGQNTSPRSARDRWCCAPPAKTRVCVDRNRITGGGVTAGIDFALTLVSIMVDRQTAEAIQLRLEYNPAPPFNAGSPDTAPPEILALLKERNAPAQARRGEAVRRAAARLA